MPSVHTTTLPPTRALLAIGALETSKLLVPQELISLCMVRDPLPNAFKPQLGTILKEQAIQISLTRPVPQECIAMLALFRLWAMLLLTAKPTTRSCVPRAPSDHTQVPREFRTVVCALLATSALSSQSLR